MVRVTQEQKQSLYRNGYLVLKNAVPVEMVERARGILNRRMGQLRNRGAAARDIKSIQDIARSTFVPGDDEVFLEMYNNTIVKKTVEPLFGSTVQEARGLQVASNYPSEPSSQINEAGYYDKDTPFYGWCGHLDGL
jgi:hypothetical protein